MGPDSVFDALADPTRRRLLEQLSADGPMTATELASSMPITRQAVVKHLGSMAAAGPLRPQRHGREVRYGLVPDRLGEATAWLPEVGQLWDRRLERLSEQLRRGDGGPSGPAWGGRRQRGDPPAHQVYPESAISAVGRVHAADDPTAARLRSPLMSTGFNILVMLHVLCVVGGFGALAYNGLYVSLAQQRPAGGTSAVLEVNKLVSSLAELLIYAALLFGVGAVAAAGNDSDIKFSDAWVSAALATYLVDIGILHGWIRPSQRRHAEVVARLEKPGPRNDEREADVRSLKHLEKRIGFGWGVFNILVVGAIYLMVFQPGR